MFLRLVSVEVRLFEITCDGNVFFFGKICLTSLCFNIGPKKNNLGLNSAGSIGNINVKKLKTAKWHNKAMRKDEKVRSLLFMESGLARNGLQRHYLL